jgi:hypothetical protein
MRFAKPPTLAVTSPREATVELDQTATSYTFEGTSIPARRSRRDGRRDAPDLGRFDRALELTVDSGAGRTSSRRRDGPGHRQARRDAGPGRHHRAVSEIEAPTLTVDQPAEGTTFENGRDPGPGTRSTRPRSRSRRLRRAGPARAGVERQRVPAAGGRRPGADHGPGRRDGTWTPAPIRSS